MTAFKLFKLSRQSVSFTFGTEGDACSGRDFLASSTSFHVVLTVSRGMRVSKTTISEEMIAVLTRCSSFGFELIKTVTLVISHRGDFLELILNCNKNKFLAEIFLKLTVPSSFLRRRGREGRERTVCCAPAVRQITFKCLEVGRFVG